MTELVERIMQRVDVGADCWMWTGSLTTMGYGRMQIDGKVVAAHRLVYEVLVGPIPEGLTLDHLCRNRACVNPDHLEPVTGRENTLRGVSPVAINAAKTHCRNGHELSGDNLRIDPGGWRRCRTCLRDIQREWVRAKRAALIDGGSG